MGLFDNDQGGLFGAPQGTGFGYGAPQQGGGFLGPNPGLLGGGGIYGALSNPVTTFGLGLASGRTPQEGLGNAAQAQLATQKMQRQYAEDAYQKYRDRIADERADRPTFGPIGQDEFGQPQYGWRNALDQSVKPAGGQQAGDPTERPGANATIDAILEGRMAPPSSFAASKPYWQRILSAAAEKEPGFDLTTWGTRFQTRKNFGSGVEGRNVTAMNTVIGHLDTMREKVDKLENYDIPWANDVKNFIATKTGRPEVGEFVEARDAVADEMARVFRAAGMSDHETKKWQANFSASGSPTQLKANVKTGVELLHSRISAMEDQYERAVGQRPDLLSPKAKESIENVQKWAGGKEKPSGPSRLEIEAEMKRRGLK